MSKRKQEMFNEITTESTEVCSYINTPIAQPSVPKLQVESK
jgi:hypothetical protein